VKIEVRNVGFNNNRYLRCALHPVTGMTEQAVNCRDYCPKTEANGGAITSAVGVAKLIGVSQESISSVKSK
jgi:hypothetical protein